MDLSMEDIIYTIIRIEEEDFGCEGRQDGAVPEVSVYLESEDGDNQIVIIEEGAAYNLLRRIFPLLIIQSVYATKVWNAGFCRNACSTKKNNFFAFINDLL